MAIGENSLFTRIDPSGMFLIPVCFTDKINMLCLCLKLNPNHCEIVSRLSPVTKTTVGQLVLVIVVF